MTSTNADDGHKVERRRSRDTATSILDVAERFAQVRGFNGFSYADVAAELNITKASLHYHFAGKAELGEALMTRYAQRFAAALDAIDVRHADAPAKLEAYATLYADVLTGQRMCLCGMLAAEYQTLPPPMRDTVVVFFDANEAWLEGVLELGRSDGSLSFVGPPREVARAIIAGLEGAMLVARPYSDVGRFRAAASALLTGVAGTAPAPADR